MSNHQSSRERRFSLRLPDPLGGEKGAAGEFEKIDGIFFAVSDKNIDSGIYPDNWTVTQWCSPFLHKALPELAENTEIQHRIFILNFE